MRTLTIFMKYQNPISDSEQTYFLTVETTTMQNSLPNLLRGTVCFLGYRK